MCGIAGLVSHSRAVDPGQLAQMCHAMEHRGPDDHGIYVSRDQHPSVGLGSQRLSILDLSPAGHMPMSNPAGDVIVSYNGEIYNHLELRGDLERRGYRYRSRTDTETVLYAYEAFGAGALPRLNGMFALAIYDQRKRQLILARDRMGIKPLYYYWDGCTFAFASELKALLTLPQIERRVDPRALDAYISLGYVPAPYTMIRGISKLQPGHYLVLEGQRLHTHEFWHASYQAGDGARQSDAELIQATRERVEQAVRSQLMSDVPVGVLLSGGLDSSIVAAVAQRHHDGPVQTFSIGFESYDGAPVDAHFNLDRDYARSVAQQLGTRHHEVLLVDDRALGETLRSLVQALDEPVWEGSFVSIYLLCKLARAHGVKVVLTGDGSDELFGGYLWYRGAQRLLLYDRVPLLEHALPLLMQLPPESELGRKARDLKRKLRASPLARYRANYDHFSAGEKQSLLGIARPVGEPDAVDELIAPLLRQVRGELPEQFSFVDLRLWVGEHFNQRLDRMSAACSVEARVPFQDNAVVDLALSIPMSRKIRGSEQKYLLRRAFADIVPPEVLQRPKRPFAAPQHHWLRRGLREWSSDLLSTERIREYGLLDPSQVQALMADRTATDEDRVQRLSILVMLQLWCETFLAAPAASGSDVAMMRMVSAQQTAQASDVV